ncbi:MAG: HTH domain-containing protein [Candidatus Omnitrophica bacterium]|nr:HTH domain-containing protein [Candidatus Omnitrophota bacterium]
MKLTNPLDKILNNEVKVKILRFLFKTNAQWNGRQIAKELGVSPTTAHKALQSLNKQGVLLLRNIGKTHVYTLKHNNFTVSTILKPLFAREEKILDNIFGIIRKKISVSSIRKYIVSIALFGSVSSRRDRPASDIDLIVIVKNAKIKSKVELIFEDISKKISKKFGNTLSPYINTELEFKSKYKKGLRVIKNILKSYKLIYGKPLERII